MKRPLIYHSQIAVKETKRIHSQVDIFTLDDSAISTSLQNVSRDRITITCDQFSLHQLLPNHAQISPKQPVSLKVNFTIYEKIDMSCHVISVRRLSKDTFQLDMMFNELDEHSEHLIDKYMNYSLKKQNENIGYREVA